MKTQQDWDRDYAAGVFDGAYDVENPARYLLLAGLLRGCGSVLDVGCGKGLLREFVEADYTGVDWTRQAIEEAQAHWPEAHFVCADAETWEPSQQFGAVVLNEVIYYAADPVTLVRRYTALAKNLVVVSVFDKRVRFWQHSKNADALRSARANAGGRLRQVIEVGQNGRKWTVLVMSAH